jgi:hypothetical protein
MVTVAMRVSVVGFALAVKVSVPLPVAEVGLTVSHVSLLDADHVVFEVTSTVAVLLAALSIVAVVAEKLNVTAAASCVTVTVWLMPPVAETVTVAERVTMLGLGSAETVSKSLPVAEAGLTVSHVWLLEAVQSVLDFTENVYFIDVLPVPAAKLIAGVNRLSVGGTPVCVTVTVWLFTPVAETVTVAERVETVGLAVTVKVSELLPVPETGLMVSQVWLLDVVHAVFEDTSMETVLLAAAPMFAVVVDTPSVAIPDAACCVTVMDWLVAPVAETVTVAVRDNMSGLTAAVKVSVPLPVAGAGLTVSQVWSLVLVHVVLEVTFTVAVLLAVASMLAVVADTPSVAVPDAACCVIVMVWLVAPVAEMVTVAVRDNMNGLAAAV